MLVAVHKRALFDMVLTDEAATNAARAIHKERLDDIVVFLGRLTLSRYESLHVPFKAMLLMQRIRPDAYRTIFCSAIRAQLHTLRLKIHVFGFTPFDAFIVTTLREAIHLENKASQLQLEVKKKLETASHHSRKSVDALSCAKSYNSDVKMFNKVIDELYESNMETVWDTGSLDVYAISREKRAVTAVAIDYTGKIYVALNMGLLKIYKTREQPNLPLRLVQKLNMKAKIRSLVVSLDGKKIFLGCGNKVIILVLANSRRRLNFKELLSFSGHTAPVNVVLQFNRFVLSGGQDSMIYLWRLNSKEPGNSYDGGSPVFCMCVMPVREENLAVDELSLTDILVCGTAKGKLLVLPMPLPNSNENATWNGFLVDAGECGVSSVRIAWNFVYAGFTDGRVKTWAIEIIKSNNTILNPIKMIHFLPVQNVQVHAGPVTCLAFTGGSLFSASYDFSILPWSTPDRLNAKTIANFSQSYREGLIYHSNCIISIGSSKTMMVTGDEGGRVVVSYPKKVREDFMASGPDSGTNIKSQPAFNFSFIEYDFKKCFLDNNGGVIEEEVILSIENCSGTAATIRCLLKKHSSFRVDICENENRSNGCEVISLLSPGSTNSKVATIFDNLHVVQYRIIFHPVESRVAQLSLEFLINEKDTVRVQLKGSGIKSKVYLSSIKLYEMGTVGIGQYGVERINVENKEDRPILVNCLAECEDKVENKSYDIITIKHNLASKHMSVIPRCFSIPPRGQVELLVRFTPPVKVDVFKMPVRAIYGGGEGTLAEMRVRSADPPGSVMKETVAVHGKRSSISNNSIGSNSSSAAISQLSKNSKHFDKKKNKKNGPEKFGLSGIVEEKEGQAEGDVEIDLEIGGKGKVGRVEVGEVEGQIDDELNDLISTTGVFDEVKALEYLYKGLRKLSPSETPCPNDLLGGLLEEVGWSMAIEGQLALLYHTESGLFIEIPNSHAAFTRLLNNKKNLENASNNKGGNNLPQPLPSLSEFKIDFMCDEACSYELWYGERLIQNGVGEQDTLESIVVHATDLYHVIDRFGSAIPTPMPYDSSKNKNKNVNRNKKHSDSNNGSNNEDCNDDDDCKCLSSGTQQLMLMVFSRNPTESIVIKDNNSNDRKPLFSNVSTQPDGRLLLHVTYIKILKGFRLGLLQSEIDIQTDDFDKNCHDDDHDHGSLQLEERIVVGGIVRVVSYMDRDLGTLTEIFEKETDLGPVPQGPILHKKNERIGGEPAEDLFSRCILNINTLLSTQKQDYIPDNGDSNNENNNLNVQDVPTHVRVVDRAVALELSDPLESTVVENMVELLETAKTISGMREVLLEKPVLTGDINRHSCSREVMIEVLVMPVSDGGDDMMKVETLASATVSGHVGRHLKSEQLEFPFNITYSSLPHLIHSHRHGVYLKVVSPKQEPFSRMQHLNSLMNQIKLGNRTKTLTCNSIFNGQWYFVIDRNSLKLVSSSIMDPLETVDITFLTRGFVAEFKKHCSSCTAVMDGRHVNSRGVEELPKQMKSTLSKLQLSNNRGHSSQFASAPLFLRDKWAEFVKHSLHRKVVVAMLQLVERTRSVAAGRIAQEVANSLKECESRLAKAASSTTSKYKKEAGAREMKDAEDAAKKRIDAIPPTSNLTFHDVYADMTKITNEFYSAQALPEDKIKNDDSKQISALILNMNYLSYFLQNDTLAGFDEPLSVIQCGVVLEGLERNNQTGAVKLEHFGIWYKLDQEKALRNELKDKKVFAYLLEEMRQKDEVLDGTNIKYKIVKGSSAKKIIKEMHLSGDNVTKWGKQEKEVERSGFYNNDSEDGDSDDNSRSHRSVNSYRMGRREPSHSGVGDEEITKGSNAGKSKKIMGTLTGFIKNMSARRFSRVNASTKPTVVNEVIAVENGSEETVKAGKTITKDSFLISDHNRMRKDASKDGGIDPNDSHVLSGITRSSDNSVIGSTSRSDSVNGKGKRNRSKEEGKSYSPTAVRLKRHSGSGSHHNGDINVPNGLVDAILGSQQGSVLSEIDNIQNEKRTQRSSGVNENEDDDSEDDDSEEEEDEDEEDGHGYVSESSYEFSEVSQNDIDDNRKKNDNDIDVEDSADEYEDASDDESDGESSSQSDEEDSTEGWEEDEGDDDEASPYNTQNINNPTGSREKKGSDSVSDWNDASDSRSGSGFDEDGPKGRKVTKDQTCSL